LSNEKWIERFIIGVLIAAIGAGAKVLYDDAMEDARLMHAEAMRRVEVLEALVRVDGQAIVRLEERINAANATLLRIEREVVR